MTPLHPRSRADIPASRRARRRVGTTTSLAALGVFLAAGAGIACASSTSSSASSGTVRTGTLPSTFPPFVWQWPATTRATTTTVPATSRVTTTVVRTTTPPATTPAATTPAATTTRPATTTARGTSARPASTTQAPTQPPTTAVAGPPTTQAATTTVKAAPAGSYPSAGSTGVQAGVALVPSGSVIVSTPGAVVEGLDISGTLTINASDVTVRNVRVTTASFAAIRVGNGASGVVIEDCEINGKGGYSNSMGVMGGATIRRCEIFGVENGVNVTGPSTITDNWIHGLRATGSPHYDGIQIDGGVSNVVVSHNHIDVTEWSQTSAVMIDNWFGPISNITVDNNLLKGGGYTVYSDGSFSGGPISGVKFTNNRIQAGFWGYALIRNNTVVQSGNVDAVTGKAIKL